MCWPRWRDCRWIVLGTFASANVWLAVVAAALVGFVLSGLGVLGWYFLSAQTASMLALILAVTNVASLDTTARLGSLGCWPAVSR
ncbi:MAG: hypothetical protein JOZ81_28520 [Chloroflexi bacterium]|nr:hypothetical protein [Chloroflexota bacterium]